MTIPFTVSAKLLQEKEYRLWDMQQSDTNVKTNDIGGCTVLILYRDIIKLDLLRKEIGIRTRKIK